MTYIFILSWLIAIWLGSAWDQGLIGAWGMWTSLSVAFGWLAVICAAKILGRKNGEILDG